nr:PLP-dependent aminotransferase family protein [Vallicoccus soli]
MGAARLAGLVGDLGAERGPRYAALAARLRLLVADGRLPVGARLPAERELAPALGLSRDTVTSAYRRLRDDGWALARQGAGTWTALPAGPVRAGWVPGPVGEGVLDLAHAAPAAPPQVPAAYAAALDELPRLLPGHGYHPGGLPGLRARIAERYARRGLPTTPEQVLVTSGALHGLSACLDVLLRRGQRVVVEDPGYPNALDALAAGGARPARVPVALGDGDGAVAALSAAARATGAPLAYLVPDAQNPTGLTLDAAQRRRLAAGLQGAGTLALVDETFAELALDGEPPPPLAAALAPGRSVSVGTLSKAVWGGLRVGWLRADPPLVHRLAAALARRELSGPVVEQLAACHLLDGLDAVLAERRPALRASRAALVAALGEHLPSWEVPVPSGGLFLWCRLPAPTSSALVAAAARRGLHLAAGPRFGAGHAFEDRLRLPYTHPAPVLRRAVADLAAAAADVAPQDGPAPAAYVV